MIDENVRPLIYGAYYPVKRIAEVYKCGIDLTDRILCRAEFNRYLKPYSRPRVFLWTPPFEAELDILMNKKGKHRCIGSKVLSKSLLEKANSFST